MASVQRVGTLTIANGQQLSGELDRDAIGVARTLIFISADGALTGVVTLQCGTTQAGGTWSTVQSPPGTDITLAAAKAVIVLANPFPRIRLSSTLAEGGPRNWEVWGEVGN